MGYKLASARDICETFASIGGFGVRPLNTANKILPRPTLVAMAMKFETKGLQFSKIFASNGRFWGTGY